MTGAFERSVAFWLRAYPRRWRAARGAEVTELLRDLSAPGARCADLGAALGLVAGGWATRRREHPPLRAWLGYHLAGRRLAPRYDGWVRDEKRSPITGARSALVVGLVLVPGWFALIAVARALGVTGWPVTVGGTSWWGALVMVAWESVAGAGRRRAALDAYFPAADPAPHFGPYVPLRDGGTRAQ